MAEPRIDYQRKVSGAALEIAGEGDRLWGHIIYPYPDSRFEQGGMDVVLTVAAELADRLRDNETLDAFFLGELSLMVDPEGGHEEESRFLSREVERRRGALREGALGAFDRIEGHWAQASEGLSLLRAVAPRLGHVIAESAEARFLLLESQADDANGWDIAHRDGITVIGRWDGNLGEGTPGALEPGDIRPLAAIFDRLADEVLPGLLR